MEQQKTIFINGRYINPAVGRNEVMNFLMINNTVVGVGYLPDDDDATVYDLQGKIVVPNIWAFFQEGTPLSNNDENTLIQNGFSAVATCDKGDLHQSSTGLIYVPHPRLKVFDFSEDPRTASIPEWAGVVINCSSEAHLNLLRREYDSGRQIQSGFSSKYMSTDWVVSGILNNLLHFCQPESVEENSMKIILDSLYHHYEMEIEKCVSLLTKGLYIAYGASPKGIALNYQPSFAIFSPTKGSTCDYVVVNGDVRFNRLTPTTDMDTTFKRSEEF